MEVVLPVIKNYDPSDFPRDTKLWEGVHITGEEDGGLVEAWVPIGSIYKEDVPVDRAHVEELASSFRTEEQHGRYGQLARTLLGHLPEFELFPILDGFHRVSACDELEYPEV